MLTLKIDSALQVNLFDFNLNVFPKRCGAGDRRFVRIVVTIFRISTEMPNVAGRIIQTALLLAAVSDASHGWIFHYYSATFLATYPQFDPFFQSSAFGHKQTQNTNNHERRKYFKIWNWKYLFSSIRQTSV